jgi:hypothetical protein
MRVALVIGVVLCVIGAVWIGQGIGTIHGSFMTGHTIWAVIGAITMLFGLALLSGVARARRHPHDDFSKDGSE